MRVVTRLANAAPLTAANRALDGRSPTYFPIACGRVYIYLRTENDIMCMFDTAACRVININSSWLWRFEEL